MNRRARRAAQRIQRKNVSTALKRAQEKLQEAHGAVARYRDMFQLAQQGLALASQMPVVTLPDDHDPADGDPNAVRLAFIDEATEKVNNARELFHAATMDLHDLLASVDDEEEPVISLHGANELPR